MGEGGSSSGLILVWSVPSVGGKGEAKNFTTKLPRTTLGGRRTAVEDGGRRTAAANGDGSTRVRSAKVRLSLPRSIWEPLGASSSGGRPGHCRATHDLLIPFFLFFCGLKAGIALYVREGGVAVAAGW